MSEERLKLIFADYEMDFIHPRNLCKSRAEFEKMCYSIWAVNELLNYMIANKTLDPIVSIRQFAAKVKGYASMNPNSRKMFTVAKEVTEDILDMFLAMQ